MENTSDAFVICLDEAQGAETGAGCKASEGKQRHSA